MVKVRPVLWCQKGSGSCSDRDTMYRRKGRAAFGTMIAESKTVRGGVFFGGYIVKEAQAANRANLRVITIEVGERHP